MREAIYSLEQYAKEVWNQMQSSIEESNGTYNSYVVLMQRKWFEITQCIHRLKVKEQEINYGKNTSHNAHKRT